MQERTPESIKADLMRQDSRIRRPWHLIAGEGFSFINRAVTPEQVLHSLVCARKVRPKAESYRGFNVGVCGIVLSEDGMERGLYHGVNVKDAPGDSAINRHGEDYVLENLRARDMLGCLAIVAPTQEDSATGKTPPALHPCARCRDRLMAAGEATENTLIVCATPDITAVQWGGINDYLAYYQEESDRLGLAIFKETPELFHPLPQAEGQPIDLRNVRFDIDTSEWDEKVAFPVLEWLREHQYDQNTY